MTITSVITGWMQSVMQPAQAKLDGTPADVKHTIAYGGGGTFASKRVTADTTMQLSAAWASVRLNARTIASCGRKVYRRTSAMQREAAEDHPLHRVLAISPNPDQTPMEFWEGMVTALNLRGNAYARIGRRGDRQVVALWPLSPDAVSVYRDASGQRRYRIGGQEDVGADEIFHLRGFGAGGDLGLSPIGYGRQTIATALAAEEVAGSTFANGLQLSGFVEDQPGAKTTNEQREGLVALFNKFAGSSQAGKIMPLPPGFSFKALGLSPEDAQLLDTRRFAVEEICRWFGVFPILIGHAAQGQTMWGSGIEQIVLAWLTLGLGTELERIEQAIEKQLILSTEQGRLYVQHNVESLLRADSASRAALYSSLGQNGVMKRNEMRAKENLPPDASPGADMLTIQSNMIPLDQLGKTPPAATQPLDMSSMPKNQADVEAAYLYFRGEGPKPAWLAMHNAHHGSMT
ncbi:phage portal protein [Sphingobium abikonense]|uniref:phage portal protein n=1 Tax=Sphingobium abikonense TaxID=86193 RepID=UPI003511055C